MGKTVQNRNIPKPLIKAIKNGKPISQVRYNLLLYPTLVFLSSLYIVIISCFLIYYILVGSYTYGIIVLLGSSTIFYVAHLLRKYFKKRKIIPYPILNCYITNKQLTTLRMLEPFYRDILKSSRSFLYINWQYAYHLINIALDNDLPDTVVYIQNVLLECLTNNDPCALLAGLRKKLFKIERDLKELVDVNHSERGLHIWFQKFHDKDTIEALGALASFRPINGVSINNGKNISKDSADTASNLIITQSYDEFVATYFYNSADPVDLDLFMHLYNIFVSMASDSWFAGGPLYLAQILLIEEFGYRVLWGDYIASTTNIPSGLPKHSLDDDEKYILKTLASQLESIRRTLGKEPVQKLFGDAIRYPAKELSIRLSAYRELEDKFPPLKY